MITLDIRPPDSDLDQIPVSVVIPMAPGEAEPRALLGQMPSSFEIILARGGTRASSMNAGAMAAQGRHLWFVHADTILGTQTVGQLLRHLAIHDDALAYFDLRFDSGGLMRLTEAGVWIRSRVFGIPFGDQALCLSAEQFKALGGYDETVPYGEDHLLVRRVHAARLQVRSIGSSVVTSARKYRDNGWLRTTFTHLCRTVSKSYPNWRILEPRSTQTRSSQAFLDPG